MKSETELKVQAYLDNELSPGEARQVAKLLTNDAEARELYTFLKDTKALVRENEPVLRLQESRDFYWSKIQREIYKEPRMEKQPTAWWVRLMAPMAGAVALFALLLSVSGPGVGQPGVLSSGNARAEATARPMHRGEVLSPEMSAITFRSEAEGVTVVWVSASNESFEREHAFDWLFE